MNFRPLLLLCLISFFGCNQAALVVQQQKVGPTYLASGNVATPDPRTPPNGQMILAEWWVPKSLLASHPILKFDVIYNDFSTAKLEYPITSRVGFETLAVLGDQFKKTNGFLAYKVEIVTDEGEIYAEWTHQLWVKLIDLDDETDEISSAIVEKSRQPSVTEIPSR